MAAAVVGRAHTGSVHVYLAYGALGLLTSCWWSQMNEISVIARHRTASRVHGRRSVRRRGTRQVRALFEGRAGRGIGQPWRDLRQAASQAGRSARLGTTVVFAAAPAVVGGTTLLVAVDPPLVATGSPLDSSADLFAVVGLLFLGTVALTLAGIDTGTSFGGMGASREITIAALVEPTILLAVFALSIPAGSANLGALVANTITTPARSCPWPGCSHWSPW